MKIIKYKSVASTNDIAKKMASRGAKHGTTIVANMQRSGRGRQGRVFYSPIGGVYMSVIVNFCHRDGGVSKNKTSKKTANFTIAQFGNTTVPMTKLTVIAAVTVTDALKSTLGINAGIKWVNDIFFEGKKIGGILTEIVGESAVVGIGLNLHTKKLPSDLPNAGSLLHVANGVTIIQMAETIQKQLLNTLTNFDSKDVLEKYRQRLILLNKRVLVMSGGVEYQATVISLNDDGGLIIERDDGKTDTLYYGEVSLK